MNKRTQANSVTALLAAVLVMANQGLRAETDTTPVNDTLLLSSSDTVTETETVTTATVTETSQGAVVVKLSNEFADFLGGEEQARQIITGLRENGLQPPSEDAVVEEALVSEPIAPEGVSDTVTMEPATDGSIDTADASTTTDAVTEPTGDATASAEATSEPTTDASSETVAGSDSTTTVATESRKTLGYGEIRHTLKLAQAELEKLGIAQPSESELNAMLYGGEINGVQVDGVLAMRADGMGWGQIAQAYGFKLGELQGKGHLHTNSAAAGAAKGVSTTKGTATGYIPSGHGHGRGLVTAGGMTVSTSHGNSGKSLGHAGGNRDQLVSLSGKGGMGAGLASAAGGPGQHGQGLAKGHLK